MKWASAIYDAEQNSEVSTLEDVIKNLSQSIKSEMEGKSLNLLVGFVSAHYKDDFEKIPELVKQEFGPDTFIGCSAGGIIGGGQEIEQKRCIAFTGAHMPDVKLKSFYLQDKDLPDLDSSQQTWHEIVDTKVEENPSFVVIPDPFSFSTDILVRGLDFAFPDSVIVGGLASGAYNAGHNGLFLNDQLYHDGLVGLSISGNVVVDTVVAQGCKPVGKPYTITKCQKNILFELNGEPAIMALKDVIDSLNDRDKELIKDSVFLGIVTDEMKEEYKCGDFLVRNIIGIEPNSGALVIGELLDNQKTIQFHVRDAATSADDLRFLLKQYRDDVLDGGKKNPAGALLFSCLGRGVYLYDQKNHDSECFKSYLGSVPLGGFFCNGEIGPVGGSTHLHGYTSAFGIFREK